MVTDFVSTDYGWLSSKDGTESTNVNLPLCHCSLALAPLPRTALSHLLPHFEHTRGPLPLSPLPHRTVPINRSMPPPSLPGLRCPPPLPFAHVLLLSADSEYYKCPDYRDPCDRDIPMCDLSHVVS
ncbi:hypothetical protein B0H10DRAFT_2438001 [Mycena sp. CBHHK59/15]|nr:hypothetical protein B0H10DRAFT_2438001 [Mycena sp. CBHHK59/15]